VRGVSAAAVLVGGAALVCIEVLVKYSDGGWCPTCCTVCSSGHISTYLSVFMEAVK
jgi:hypothetical protein